MSNYRIFYLLSLVLLTTLCGCANPRQVMVNPTNWQQAVCSASGWGWLGAPLAYKSYSNCVDDLKVLGLIPLEELEAKDTSKFNLTLDATGKQADQPKWQTGDFWEYSLSSGGISRFIVQKTGTFEETVGYHVAREDGKETFYDQSLGLMVIFNGGNADTKYEPALHPFDFPLFVGKRWDASGDMHRATGHIELSNHFEVKGYGRVKVPAGEFDAFYIMNRSDYGARISELWYSPAVKNYVKGVLYTDNGKVTEELSSFKSE